MKKNIDLETLKTLYARYKKHLIYLFITLICFVLFLFIIFPKIQEILNFKQKNLEENEKLEALKNNYKLLSSLDEETLNSQFNTTVSALPIQKYFADVLNAVSNASAKTGVIVGDYNISVGSIKEKDTNTTGFPSLSLKISVQSDLKGTASFLRALSQSLPLSEVSHIELSPTSTGIALNFFYKTLPQEALDEMKPLKPLSSGELALIYKLSLWSSNFQEFVPQEASASSEPF